MYDKEGKFLKKVVAPVPAGQPKKADSVPVKKEEPRIVNTTRNEF